MRLTVNVDYFHGRFIGCSFSVENQQSNYPAVSDLSLDNLVCFDSIGCRRGHWQTRIVTPIGFWMYRTPLKATSMCPSRGLIDDIRRPQPILYRTTRRDPSPAPPPPKLRLYSTLYRTHLMPHPIIEINELTQLVADYLLTISPKSLVSLACACRALEEQALSTLWSEQSSFKTLIKYTLLPTRSIWAFGPPPRGYDW